MRSLWKGPFSDARFDHQLSTATKTTSKKPMLLPSRNSTILAAFLNKKVAIPRGQGQGKFTVKAFMLGHKFGEFVHTKLMGRAIHERKKKKK